MAKNEIRDGLGKKTPLGDLQRCFLGFELTGDSRAYLAGLLAPLHEKLKGKYGWPVRLLPDRNWHATLLFFQRLTAGERARVWRQVEADALAGVWADLQFAWSGLALWPSPRRPNLICLEAPEYAPALQWPLVDRLTDTPFSKGETDHLLRYRPHITVMRFRRGGRKPNAGQWIEIQQEIPPIDPRRVRFDHVSLFLSTLSSGNPIYPREYTAPLQGR